jgi:peptide/nickel transport system permease protein
LGVVSGAILLLLVIVIMITALLAPQGYQHKRASCRHISPASYCDHKFFLLGTDDEGRDLLAGVLIGGGVTLSIAIVVVAISLVIGALLGCLSAYYGGLLDDLMQRLGELTMAIPRLALLVALSYLIIGSRGERGMLSFWGIIAVLSSISWAPLARVIRGRILALREEEFIVAARAIGLDDFRIIINHIIPNIRGYLVVAATLLLPEIIILESVLSYFGYGIRGEWVSWGSLLTENNEPLGLVQLSYHPWLFISALFIFVTVVALNLFGDALRDTLEMRH